MNLGSILGAAELDCPMCEGLLGNSILSMFVRPKHAEKISASNKTVPSVLLLRNIENNKGRPTSKKYEDCSSAHDVEKSCNSSLMTPTKVLSLAVVKVCSQVCKVQGTPRLFPRSIKGVSMVTK